LKKKGIIQPVTPELVKRIQELVKDVEFDIDRPLPPGDDELDTSTSEQSDQSGNFNS
jgi:hypothetical protein